MEREEVEILIKSCIVSRKGGATLAEINRDFKQEAGCDIPYRKFMFTTLEGFLKAIKDVVLTKGNKGQITLTVQSEKTAHIAALVSRQKDQKKGKISKKTKRIFLKHRSTRAASDWNNRPLYNLNYAMTKNANAGPKIAHFGNTDVRGMPLVIVNSKDPDEDTTLSDFESEDKENVSHFSVASGSKNSAEKKDEPERLHTLKVTVNNCKNGFREVRICDISTEESGSEERQLPSLAGYTLFGDDFFYGFAKDHLGFASGEMGMCKIGMTLAEARNVLRDQPVLPKKIVLCVGSNDVSVDRPFKSIAFDLYKLIDDLLALVDDIVVCTIPPLLGDSRRSSVVTLLSTNELIRCLPEDAIGRVKVIDLHSAFTKQHDAKQVLKMYRDVKFPIVWNERGCTFVNEILIQKLNSKIP